MRLELTVTRVAPLRPAIARSPCRGASRAITVPGCWGFFGVFDQNGNAFFDGGLNGGRVHDLGTEKRQLGGFGVRNHRNGPGRRDFRGSVVMMPSTSVQI